MTKLNHPNTVSFFVPFDMEEDCSKHQQLIAMITGGLTDEISAGLGAEVSVEARLLVSRLLTVTPADSIPPASIPSPARQRPPPVLGGAVPDVADPA